jgi:hypothetical protein
MSAMPAPTQDLRAFARAINKDDARAVRRMIKKLKLDVNAVIDRMAPLHWAAVRNSTAVARTLLDAGADINLAEPVLGMTPLMTAASQPHTRMIELLLDRGADAKRLTRKGQSAVNFLFGRERDKCRPTLAALLSAVCPAAVACLAWPVQEGDL